MVGLPGLCAGYPSDIPKKQIVTSAATLACPGQINDHEMTEQMTTDTKFDFEVLMNDLKVFYEFTVTDTSPPREDTREYTVDLSLSFTDKCLQQGCEAELDGSILSIVPKQKGFEVGVPETIKHLVPTHFVFTAADDTIISINIKHTDAKTGTEARSTDYRWLFLYLPTRDNTPYQEIAATAAKQLEKIGIHLNVEKAKDLRDKIAQHRLLRLWMPFQCGDQFHPHELRNYKFIETAKTHNVVTLNFSKAFYEAMNVCPKCHFSKENEWNACGCGKEHGKANINKRGRDGGSAAAAYKRRLLAKQGGSSSADTA